MTAFIPLLLQSLVIRFQGGVLADHVFDDIGNRVGFLDTLLLQFPGQPRLFLDQDLSF